MRFLPEIEFFFTKIEFLWTKIGFLATENRQLKCSFWQNRKIFNSVKTLR